MHFSRRASLYSSRLPVLCIQTNSMYIYQATCAVKAQEENKKKKKLFMLICCKEKGKQNKHKVLN